MTPPILHLAPHENPLHRRTDLDGEAVFFEAHCFGRVRGFVGQSINEDGYGNILFFQLEDELQRGNFVYSGKDKNSAQSYKDFGKTSSARTISHLTDCIESNSWGRYFVLFGTRDWWRGVMRKTVIRAFRFIIRFRISRHGYIW